MVFLLTGVVGVATLVGAEKKSEQATMKNEDVVSFQRAVTDNDLPGVERMLQQNPALAATKNETGVSVLLLALYRGHADIAVRLTAARESLDIFEAAAVGQLNSVSNLVEGDAALLNTYSPDGFTPLHLAAFFGRIEVVRYILAHGGDVDAIARNASQVRPLHSAAATRDACMVRVMLSAGADPDTKQSGGHTALHSAVMHGNVAMTIALLAAGADPSVKNDEGKSAMDLEPSDHRDTVEAVLRDWSAMRTTPVKEP